MSTSSNPVARTGTATATLAHLLLALAQHSAASVHRLWTAYWDRKARRATLLMLEALDDRTLRDIGLSRSEIRSAVFGGDPARPRPYDPQWRNPAVR
jgi:uncharacterized protein YjiS (DUF1127 family)